jgi:hypothetical protein
LCVPPLSNCDFGICSLNVSENTRTDSCWTGGAGREGVNRILDTVPAPKTPSDLEWFTGYDQRSGGNDGRENDLHFVSAEVYKRTIHPRCGDCHYNHIGTLKHLRCIAETRNESISPGLLVANKDVPCPLALVGFTGIEIHQRQSVIDRENRKKIPFKFKNMKTCVVKLRSIECDMWKR